MLWLAEQSIQEGLMIDRLTRGGQGVGTGPILRIVGNDRAPTM